MRYCSIIAVIVLAAAFLTPTTTLAGTKFKNKDTAKNRQANVFGTGYHEGGSDISVGKNEKGDTVIRNTATPKKKADKAKDITIQVEPQVKWPKDSTTTSTTTETTVDTTGNTTTKTTTTETKTE